MLTTVGPAYCSDRAEAGHTEEVTYGDPVTLRALSHSAIQMACG
jgi:hypothetical protein